MNDKSERCVDEVLPSPGWWVEYDTGAVLIRQYQESDDPCISINLDEVDRLCEALKSAKAKAGGMP